MNITEALGWATMALEVRATTWRDAAKGEFNSNEELYDADTDERNNMADMYEEALKVLTTFGIVALQVDDKCNVRMVNIKATSATPEATSASNIRAPRGWPNPRQS